jgi:hypothetical protein
MLMIILFIVGMEQSIQRRTAFRKNSWLKVALAIAIIALGTFSDCLSTSSLKNIIN